LAKDDTVPGPNAYSPDVSGTTKQYKFTEGKRGLSQSMNMITPGPGEYATHLVNKPGQARSILGGKLKDLGAIE